MRKCFADDRKICDCQPTAGRICEGIVALSKDAERYRWLLDNLKAYECCGPALVVSWPAGIAFAFDRPSASIDTAMAEAPAVG